MYRDGMLALLFWGLVLGTVAGARAWGASSEPPPSAAPPPTERAAGGTLLLGCSGLSVEVAQSSAPIPLGNAVLEASGLIGMGCAEALQLLLDHGRISAADIEGSSHLVINNTPTAGGDDDDVDVPDCIIWDIDTGTLSQLACDLRNAGVIEAHRTALGGVSSLVGMRCVEALDALGGLQNVRRTSAVRRAVMAPRASGRGNGQSARIPGSLLVYQLPLYLE